MLVFGWLLPLSVGCSPSDKPRTDSQTNWYRVCESAADCDGLDCVCGVCTRLCDVDDGCGPLDSATCAPAETPGAIAVCGGRLPFVSGLCLPACTEESCGEGQACIAGRCRPIPTTTFDLVVDSTIRHQELLGIGATLAYVEDQIVAHPQRDALYEAMFSDLGLDVLRLRNRYGQFDGMNLGTSAEIVDAATTALERPPVVIMTSWSPPPHLKANAAAVCAGNADTCTLTRNLEGGFNYLGFATHWEASLNAYREVDLVPDFIGIQNNPDFVPVVGAPGEACRFLPTEGTASVFVAGAQQDVEYPGFAEALNTVVEVIPEEIRPAILAPETSGLTELGDYVSELDLSEVEGIAHHLYDVAPRAIDPSQFEALSELGQAVDRPIFQTELRAAGIDAAVLAHYALVNGGVAAHLQGTLVAPASAAGLDPTILVTLDANDFALLDSYHALRHFSRYTDPGWVRVEATAQDEDLLVSAWQSPEETALTVVIINVGLEEQDLSLSLGREALTSSVTRTVFPGVERSAELGPLPPEGVLYVPSQAIVTVEVGF